MSKDKLFYERMSKSILYFLAQYLIDLMKYIVGERYLTGFGVFFDLLGTCRANDRRTEIGLRSTQARAICASE